MAIEQVKGTREEVSIMVDNLKKEIAVLKSTLRTIKKNTANTHNINLINDVLKEKGWGLKSDTCEPSS
jgi:hypothetical protein